MKLKTLSDYILTLFKTREQEINRYELGKIVFINLVLKYIEFLMQKSHPSQFIEWDEKNNCPMEKPESSDYNDSGVGRHLYVEALVEYKKAESKVLFEGFELVTIQEGYYRIENDEVIVGIKNEGCKWSNNKYETIQQLAGKVKVKDEVGKKLYI